MMAYPRKKKVKLKLKKNKKDALKNYDDILKIFMENRRGRNLLPDHNVSVMVKVREIQLLEA